MSDLKSVVINLVPFGDPAEAEQAADVARNAYLDALHASDMVAKAATSEGAREGVAWLMDLARNKLARRDYAGCYANAMMLLECVANGFQPVRFNVLCAKTETWNAGSEVTVGPVGRLH